MGTMAEYPLICAEEARAMTSSRSVIVMIALSCLSFALSLLSDSIVARFLGLEVFGIYFLATNIVGLALVGTTLGWPALLVRNVAAYSERTDGDDQVRGLMTSALYQCALSSIVFSVIWFLALLLLPSSYASLGKQVPTLVLSGTMAAIAYAYWEGRGKVITVAVLSDVGLPMALTATFLGLLIVLPKGEVESHTLLWTYTSFMVVTSGLVLVVTVMALRRIKKPIVLEPMKVPGFGHFSSDNIWVLVASSANLVLIYTDSLMLSVMSDLNEVGTYGIATAAVPLVAFGISAANAVLGPRLAALYEQKKWDEARSEFRKAQALSCVWAVISLGLIWLFSEQIVVVLTGSSLNEGISYCLIALAVGQFANASTGPVAMTFFSLGRVREFGLSVACAAVCNVIGNLILIPGYGAFGASISKSVSICILNIAQYLYAKHLKLV